MKISDFTRPELDYLAAVCNFTADEEKLFELRAAGKPLEDCAEIMHRSLDSVKQLSRKVNSKIMREK